MSVNRKRRNSIILGASLLAVMVLVLLISPGSFFSPMVTFIDTSLYKASPNAVSVQTKYDFGSQEVMANFPKTIGKWNGFDYPVDKIMELLKADMILMRAYEPSVFTQPLFLSIVQSKTETSFHPPKVCFTSQGYQIQEEGQDSVIITDAEWIGRKSNFTIPLNKIVITKNKKDGTITERRLVLFCYVKGNQFYSDTVTMVQVDGLVPLQDPYNDTLNEEKEFLNAVIPLMFSPAQTDNTYRPLVLTMAGWGVPGYILIAVMVLIPVGIIVGPRVGRGKGSQNSKIKSHNQK